MSILENINDNFFGASYENQKVIFNTMLNSLNDRKFKQIRKEFNKTFKEYFETLDSLLSFEDFYKTFNSDKRRITRRFALKALIESAKYHHHDHSDSNIGRNFLYFSEGLTESDKIREYLSYFKPQSISSEEVQEFLTTYEDLDLERKSEFVEVMTYDYDRLHSLMITDSIPVRSPMLKQYKPLIQSIIGEDIMPYYDSLYPVEQIDFILKIIRSTERLNDEKYLNAIKEEMNKNPKYIRKLKKQVLYSCQRIVQ